MILDKNDVSASMHRLIVLDKKTEEKEQWENLRFFPTITCEFTPPIKFAENCGLHATDLSQFASKLQK